jgi:hypothetical protein
VNHLREMTKYEGKIILIIDGHTTRMTFRVIVYANSQRLSLIRLVHLNNCRVHFTKVTEQFSSGINCCMFPAHLIVPTWPCQISGYSGVSRQASLAEALSSPKNYYNYQQVFKNFWREFCCGIDGGFRGLD